MRSIYLPNKSIIKIFTLLILVITSSPNLHAQIFTSKDKDRDKDKETGAEVAKQVEEQIGIYQAPETTEYLQAIGKRLVSNLKDRKFDFQFHVVDQWEPNAFALPGGYIYFSRGLLILANDEGEIAGVMGHEITHVTERHSASQQKRAIVPGLLSVPGAIVGSVVSEDLGNLINSPINMIGKVSMSSYSRKHESEADELGMRLSAKSGYDPLLLATMLQQLEKDVEMLTNKKREYSFFDSHPMTPDRVEDVHDEAEDLKWTKKPDIAGNKADFLKKLDGLYYTENPAQGIFRGKKFLHPDMNFTITFPGDWIAVNTPSLVGAYNEDQEALIFINAIGGATDPEQLGKALVDELQNKHKKKAESAEPVKIGTWPGYMVKFNDTSGRETAHVYYLWVTINDLTYGLIGAGVDRYKENLRKTVLSLRPLTSEERNSITGIRLRIAEAKSGETLAELSKRTDNVWEADYTAMINNIPEETILEKGQLIKIAKEEKYVSGGK
jgi:predicted Zn-dependent protease